MALFPLPDIPYRIQSAETGGHLELRDIDMKAVKLQDREDDKILEQQWIFVDHNEKNRTYTVLNAATKSLRHPRYLTIDPNAKRVVAITTDLNENYSDDYEDIIVPDEPDVKSWLINEINHDGVYTITCACAGNKVNREIFLVVDEEDRANFIKVKASNRNNFPQNRMWRVLEVSGTSDSATASSVSSPSKDSAKTPAAPANPAPETSAPKDSPGAPPCYEAEVPDEIPAGTYKVKNIVTGHYLALGIAYLDLSPDGTLFTLTYTGKSNGELTLRSDKANIGSMGLILRAVEDMWQWDKWILEGHTDPIDGYCYYICDSSDPRFVFSADTQKSGTYDVVTVARKRPRYAKHLWKFELSTRADPVTLPKTSAPTTSVPSDGDPFPPRYSTNVYPEIKERYYKVQNVGTGEYLDDTGFPSRQLYGSRTGNSYGVRFVEKSAEFRLYRSESGGNRSLIIRETPPLESDSTHPSFNGDGWWGWALDRHEDLNGGYCYHICDSRNTQIVISGDRYTNWKKETYFPMKPKRPGCENDLWRFKFII